MFDTAGLSERTPFPKNAGMLAKSPSRPLRLPFVGATLLVLALSSVAGSADREPNCQLESGGESTVLAVTAPQTLHLADGRLIHLAEIIVPSAVPGSGFDPSSAATEYLRSKTLGRKVEIKFGGNRRDRYGIFIAHVYVADRPAFWLQEALVSAGLALAFPQADNYACSRQLASFEEKARQDHQGHWGLALFKVLSARDTRSILNSVQTYQIIEGEIASVTQAGARTSLHFAEENKFAFNVTIEPAARKQLDREDIDDWQGKWIRIRGWVEKKKGPTISITQAEQVELTQKPASRSTTQSK